MPTWPRDRLRMQPIGQYSHLETGFVCSGDGPGLDISQHRQNPMNIRPMDEEDAEDVLAIYAEGIEDGLATFETQCPSWEEWDESHLQECRLVAESDGTVIGWAALSPVSKRGCYRGVAEVSVYVGRTERRRGVGRALLKALVRASERAGFWTLQGTTLEDNTASLRVQADCGFRVVGTRERISQLDGRWRSTVVTERRSAVVGIERSEDGPEPPPARDPGAPCA
jgi:L-amino acid N-acyltransferase YncA